MYSTDTRVCLFNEAQKQVTLLSSGYCEVSCLVITGRQHGMAFTLAREMALAGLNDLHAY